MSINNLLQISFLTHLGPVVQNIVSLTTLLRHQLVKYKADYIIKYSVIFVGKM